MSKKIVLVGVLLLLFSSVVYALSHTDTFDSPEDLLVELVLPAQDLVIGEEFWVEIWVTSFSYPGLNTFKIQLSSANPEVVTFTGTGEMGIPFSPTLVKWSGSTSPGGPPVGYPVATYSKEISGGGNTNYLKPGIRTLLGKLKMKVHDHGSFSIKFEKQSSYATSGISVKYALKWGGIKIVKSTFCVPTPKAQACAGKCGKVDNGCGAITVCGHCKITGQACSTTSNVCVDALGLALPNANDKALCEAVIKVPGAEDKTLLSKQAETLQDWGKSCSTNADCKAGYSCKESKCTATKVSILSPIFALIKDWLDIKFSLGLEKVEKE